MLSKKPFLKHSESLRTVKKKRKQVTIHPIFHDPTQSESTIAYGGLIIL